MSMTKEEYAKFTAAVEKFFEQEGIENLSATGDEEYFSWRACDCCSRNLGGMRQDANGYNAEHQEIFEYSVCVDCLYYAEYGQLDDQTMMDMVD